MTDYIKKSVLLEAIAMLQPSADEYDTQSQILSDATYLAARDMFDDVMTVIEGASPADVAPVVHGRWIKNPMGYVPIYCCSVCDEDADNDRNLTPYCPYCGAKMDESEESNESRM